VRALLLAATAYGAACTIDGEVPRDLAQPALRFVRGEPTPGARDVPVDTAIDLYFSVPLAAEGLREGSVALQSGLVQSSLRLRVDLLAGRLRARPDVVLRPELDYRLVVNAGLHAIDGSRLAAPVAFSFTTGNTRVPPPPAPRAPSAAELQPLWSTRCVEGCHSAANARAGLDLSTPAAALRGLRDVASDQSDLPRVVPGDHARSYLLRKLLGGAPTRGLPMPPSGSPLTAEELRLVADWIDGGALP